ncbi:unnamed protein product [Cylicostephanus goldi]|uniref:Uncharacterized protein n=1 Tax=Cylicostephanus goldi TaxID=71465 RepID=A0A3P6RHI2_CYLGO|nr:unnamed protein product [Cylicostephanus goldi]
MRGIETEDGFPIAFVTNFSFADPASNFGDRSGVIIALLQAPTLQDPDFNFGREGRYRGDIDVSDNMILVNNS